MKKMNYGKENISIEIIGKQRFWIGIIAGLITAISLSMFIDYWREILKFIPITHTNDLLVFPRLEIKFFDYFFSSFSTVFGLGITLWIWLISTNNLTKKRNVYKRLAQTIILLNIWLYWAFIARLGSILPIILYGQIGFENQLNLFSEYWLLFVLIPCVIFLGNWYIVRLVYKSTKWILHSLWISIILIVILTNFKTVNRTIIRDAYHNTYAVEYEYIASELEKAKEYGVEFSERTVTILKQNNTASLKELVENVQKSFAKNRRVSIDTLILQKIIIHNFKSKVYDFHGRDQKDKNWSYAFPEQIYAQIKMYENDCVEIKYLFEILELMIYPIISKDLEWDKSEEISKYDERLNYMKRFYEYSTNSLISRLNQVVIQLNKEKKYEKYHYLIPVFDIEPFKDNRWQIDYKLNLDSIKNTYEKKHQGITRGVANVG
jgi:hypothetical protein